MRAQQPVELAWDEIPLHTQLDVLIYDMIEGGHWVTVKSWARKHTSSMMRGFHKSPIEPHHSIRAPLSPPQRFIDDVGLGPVSDL